MASANPKTSSVRCPGCGAGYEFPPSMAGKRGRCANCGELFTVPATKAKKAPSTDLPEFVGVECHLCGTRMYGRLADVGKKLKCPDCNALTVLPPPPRPTGPNIPAAMEGEQYELWEPEVTTAELAARQTTYIAVACSHCGTLMYATEKQVGQPVACPDCGRKHVVPPPARPKPAPSPLVSDLETPALDPRGPVKLPSAMSPELRRKVYEEERDSEYGRALAKARRTGRPIEVDVRGRPIIPRFPLVTGVAPFLFSKGVPVRIVGVAVGYFASVTLLLFGLELAMSGGFGAVAGMCIFALGCGLTMICTSVAFSMFLAVVAESSDGAKQIANWPNVFDWFGNFFALAVAAMVSGMPGWAIARIDSGNSLFALIAISTSMVLCFPIVVLSQLDIDSMWAVLSPRVLRSLLRCPISWMTFFLETGAIAAVCIAATRLVAGLGINPMIAAAPLGALALFLYARLLGRLGWRLAEAMSHEE